MKLFRILMMLVLVSSTMSMTACRGSKWRFWEHRTSTPPPIPPDDMASRPPITEGNLVRGQFKLVYFALDQAAINPSEGPKLDAVVQFMRSDEKAIILIEGHCDERGTAEYNRSLGEKRALAARSALIQRGADGARIQTISYGKDKPADTGATEASHAKNRRAEFVVVKP